MFFKIFLKCNIIEIGNCKALVSLNCNCNKETVGGLFLMLRITKEKGSLIIGRHN